MNSPTDAQLRDEARYSYTGEQVDVDEDADVIRVSNGAWVRAWLYVPIEKDDEGDSAAVEVPDELA